MPEYIERKSALSAVALGANRRDMSELIHKIPAADVVEVVRCRDCKFRSNEWTGCPKLNGTITDDEFFCKCGIKREES